MACLLGEFEFATVVLHNLSRYAQSQSHSFTHLLGRKEWLHDLLPELQRNASTTVNNGEDNRTVLQNHVQPDPSAYRLLHNRIESVLQQVQQHLPDLDLAAGNHKGGIDIRHQQIDGVMPKAFPADLQRPFDNFRDRGRAHLILGTLTSQMAHAFYDPSNAVGGFKNAFAVSQDDGQWYIAFL